MLAAIDASVHRALLLVCPSHAAEARHDAGGTHVAPSDLCAGADLKCHAAHRLFWALSRSQHEACSPQSVSPPITLTSTAVSGQNSDERCRSQDHHAEDSRADPLPHVNGVVLLDFDEQQNCKLRVANIPAVLAGFESGGKAKRTALREEARRRRREKMLLSSGEDKRKAERRVRVVSAYGRQSVLSLRELARFIVEALTEEREQHNIMGELLSRVQLGPGDSGTILLTTTDCLLARAQVGSVPCPVCNRFVRVATQGLEWHLKMVHGVHDHRTAAYQAAAASRLAIVPVVSKAGSRAHDGTEASEPIGVDARKQGNRDPERAIGVDTARLDPNDFAAAFRDPASLHKLIAEGRVRSLGAGLDACRSGDLAELSRLVHSRLWDPAAPESLDRNGVSAMLWAAGGGHIDCCRFLADECGLDPNPAQVVEVISRCGRGGDRDGHVGEHAGSGAGALAAVQHARRGFNGRTALHYAARNGHLPVIRWLVEERGCAVDHGTADGTTAFCWAAWQGHEAVLRYLAQAGCNPHLLNSYGCNAAMWATQSSAPLALCCFLHTVLGVDFTRVNANGQGCLHKAAQRGRRDICEWLLRKPEEGGVGLAGEETFAPNAAEKSSPSDLARYGGHDELAEFLALAENHHAGSKSSSG